MRIRKILQSLFLVCAFLFPLYAEEKADVLSDTFVDVLLLSNPENTNIDETGYIKSLLEKHISNKYSFSDREKEYFLSKKDMIGRNNAEKAVVDALRSENDELYLEKKKILDEYENVSKTFTFPESLPVRVTEKALDGFDVDAIFGQSRILARKVARDNGCDFMVIPGSVILDNNLIRSRLILYSYIDDEFHMIYDDVIPLVTEQGHIRENFIKLFKYLVSEEYGVVGFANKDYSIQITVDGEDRVSPCVLKAGSYDVVIASDGFDDWKKTIEVEAGKVIVVEYDLNMKQNSDILFNSDGRFYSAFSSDKGAFTLPAFFEEYKTPASISFSYPGYDTRYISLTGDIRSMDIRLKPSYLSDQNFMDLGTGRFYSSVLLTLLFFAVDVTSRSFLNAYPESRPWEVTGQVSSYLGYFSLSFMLFGLIDYYFGSVYAFE